MIVVHESLFIQKPTGAIRALSRGKVNRISKVDLSSVPDMAPLTFQRPEMPENIVNAMGEYQAMLDAIRDGLINKVEAVIPEDPQTRADHLKAFGYFNDAAMIGICALPDAAVLDRPILNPDIDRLADAAHAPDQNACLWD